MTVAEGARGAASANGGAGDVLLDVAGLRVDFHRGRQTVQAVAGVNLTIRRGETLGLVGESGCGKSTTGRAIVQVERPTAGRITFDGIDLTALGGRELREARIGIQMIFQDPISSLNPRRKVRDIVAEPLDIWHRGADGPQRGGGHDARGGGPRPRGGRRAATPRVLRRSVPAHQHRPLARDASPSSWCATRWSRHSTSRCRRRSSTCSRTSRPVTVSRCCSSPTTWPWSRT